MTIAKRLRKLSNNNSLKNNKIFKLFATLGLLFLILPIIVLIIFSFNDSKIMTTWGGFSIKWYKELLNDYDIFVALSNSLIVAFSSSCLSVIVAIAFSLVIVNNKTSNLIKKFLNTLITIQFAIPEVILAIAMLMLSVFIRDLLKIDSLGDMLGLIISHSVLTATYATTIMSSRLASINQQIFEAAEDLGADNLSKFVNITFPIIFPSVVSSWLLCFILSMDDFVVAIFNSGPGATTLPVLIASRIRLGLSPEINALATIIIFIVSLVLILRFILKIINNKSNYAKM